MLPRLDAFLAGMEPFVQRRARRVALDDQALAHAAELAFAEERLGTERPPPKRSG